MIQNLKIKLTKVYWFLGALTMVFALNSCEQYEFPEAGSIPDKTPPEAGFSFTASQVDYLEIAFSNLSFSSTDYVWNFGDGTTSIEMNPTHVFPGEGTYDVVLTATDKLGVSNMTTQGIELIEPVAPSALLPPVLEGGFEDNSLPDGSGDGRDSWRSDLGEIMQITSSPTHSGGQAAKFPSDGTRLAYQELTVTPNTDYVLTYYYTMKETAGSITVTMLAGALTDLANVESQTLASNTGSDITDANAYVKVDLAFNSGDNSTVAILVTNAGNESRIDDFSIALAL